jgi:polygalacturonase
MHVRVLVAACCCWALAVQVLSSSTQHVTVDSTVASAEVFNVRHYGAVGDNTTLDTISVRAAAKALFHAGGGTLLFPSGGNFLTGPFNISSNSIVVIEAGATVTGSIREEDYPLVDPIAGPHPYGGSMPHPLIYATGATNVTLTGGGTVDGLDQPWYPGYPGNWAGRPGDCLTKPPCGGPTLILFRNSTDVTMSNIAVIRSRNFALHFALVDNLHVEAVTSHVGYGDSIIIASVRNALVENCDFRANKNAINVGSGIGAFARPTRNVTLRRIRVTGQDHGGGTLSIGSIVGAGVYDITFEHIFLNGTSNGLRIETRAEMSGIVDGITYRNITGVGMGACPAWQKQKKGQAWMDIDINLLGGLGKKSKCNTTVSNVLFEDIAITGGPGAGQMFGSGECEITNITMKNVRLGDGTPKASFGACTVRGGVCAGKVDPCPPCFARAAL